MQEAAAIARIRVPSPPPPSSVPVATTTPAPSKPALLSPPPPSITAPVIVHHRDTLSVDTTLRVVMGDDVDMEDDDDLLMAMLEAVGSAGRDPCIGISFEDHPMASSSHPPPSLALERELKEQTSRRKRSCSLDEATLTDSVFAGSRKRLWEFGFGAAPSVGNGLVSEE